MLGKTHPRCCDRESNCPKPAAVFSVAEFKHIVKQLTAEHQANTRCVRGIETLPSERFGNRSSQNLNQVGMSPTSADAVTEPATASTAGVYFSILSS